MEKKSPAGPAPEALLGPRPTPRPDAVASLSAARTAVLERLRIQPEPITLTALTSATGLHANTVRGHLLALVRQGLVRRHRAVPDGRGRPAWLYETTDAHPGSTPSEYVGLATALAAAIHRGSDSPRADGIDAGTGWGRELARNRGTRPGAGRADAHHHVIGLLDDLGFAPEGDEQGEEQGPTVRLTCCPLLEAADRYPDVVCGVHLGIVRGALSEYGAAPDGTELLPFAEPGACLLALAPAPEPAAR